jgi:tetratricopeptide (TPR) repeat protein
MNNKFFKMFAVVCLSLVFFHAPIFSIGGALKGNVKEKGTGKPIEKVKITIVVLKSSSLQYELFTDEKGNYFKTGLENGMYRLNFEKEGYVPIQSSIRLAVDQQYEFNVELEAMQVKSAVSLLDMVSAAKKLMDACKYDEAILKISEVIAKEPTNFILYFNRAVGYEKKGDKGKAIADYSKSLELKPDFLLSLAALGRFFAKDGNYEKAVEYYKKAFDLGIIDPVTIYNYGACLINIGKNDEAKIVFEKLISLDPNYPDAYYQLGIIYVGLSDNAKAKENFLKFLQLDPQNENAPVAKEILNTLK